MRRQSDRYALTLPVELSVAGRELRVMLQDVSRSGMFLQLALPLPVGTAVRVAITPDGRRFATDATVTHALSAADARVLGRNPGIGIAFAPPQGPEDELFAIAIERLVRRQRATTMPMALHVVFADPQTRLLERMSTALGEAGFSVATATTGVEALSACLRQTPDVVILDRELPVFDAFRVLRQLRRLDALAAVPAIVTSDDPADVGLAFEHGADDFIAKPLSPIEVTARARRLATPVLRGSLAEIGLPAVLTMLEQERKTGRLTVRGHRVDIVDGQLAGGDLAELMSLVDCREGTFELSDLVAPVGDQRVSIMRFLLESARLRDESTLPAVRV